MANDITDTSETAEAEWDGEGPPGDRGEDISATREVTDDKIQFHVQMRGYTQAAMDDLIVEAAARLIVGRHNEKAVAKLIETKCIELLTQKATGALDKVTSEIIDQPLTPSFGEKKPVTMREFLGLYGREYLTQMVGSDGKPTTDSWHKQARMEWIVSRAMDAKFTTDIEKATNGAVREIRTVIEARHKSMLASEKARMLEAVTKLLA